MKLKTQQAVSKRLRVTKKGKIIHRKSGQDHFKAKHPGTYILSRRRDQKLSKTGRRVVRELIPYR